MKILCISLALALMFTACGGKAPKTYQSMLNTWEGEHVDKLVIAWGPPTNSFPLTDGGKVLEYTRQRVQEGRGGGAMLLPLGTGAILTPIGKRKDKHFICVTRVHVDGFNIIAGLTYQGNDCKA